MVYKRRERVVAQDSCQWAYAELTFTPQTEEVSVVVNFNTLSYDYLDYEDDYYETYYGVEQGDLLSSVRARLFERHLCLCPSMRGCGLDHAPSAAAAATEAAACGRPARAHRFCARRAFVRCACCDGGPVAGAVRSVVRRRAPSGRAHDSPGEMSCAAAGLASPPESTFCFDASGGGRS